MLKYVLSHGPMSKSALWRMKVVPYYINRAEAHSFSLPSCFERLVGVCVIFANLRDKHRYLAIFGVGINLERYIFYRSDSGGRTDCANLFVTSWQRRRHQNLVSGRRIWQSKMAMAAW